MAVLRHYHCICTISGALHPSGNTSVFRLIQHLQLRHSFASKMFRTIMSTAGSRVAARFPLALRSPLAQSTALRTVSQRSFNSTAQRTTKHNPSTNFTFTFNSHARPSGQQSTILQRLRSSIRFFNSSRFRKNGKPTSTNPTPNLVSPKGASEGEPTTLGGRLRKLSREYGWSALGVYLALSALDFPFCYLLVRHLGTDRIGKLDVC